MQRIKDFFTGPDGDSNTQFFSLVIVLALFASFVTYTLVSQPSTQEERVALIGSRIVEVHPRGNPTVVCFVLDNPGNRSDSLSCVKK